MAQAAEALKSPVERRVIPVISPATLEKVRDALTTPRPDQIVILDEDVRRRAARCINRMFELAPKD